MSLTSLPSFVGSFPNPKDGASVKVSCHLDGDTTSPDAGGVIHMQAVIPEPSGGISTLYVAKLDVVELSKIRSAADADLSWELFVKAIDVAFQSQEVQLAESGNNLTFKFKAGKGSAQFVLAKKAGNPSSRKKKVFAELELLGSAYKLYESRVRDKVMEEKMQKVADQLKQIEEKEKGLKEEQQKMQEQAQTYATEEKAAMEEYQRLTKSLQDVQREIEKDRVEKQGDYDVLQAESLVTYNSATPATRPGYNPMNFACLGRAGRTERTVRDHDAFLLRCIKSKFAHEEFKDATKGNEESKDNDKDKDEGDDDEDAKAEPYMNVIAPFAKNEWLAQIKQLGEGEQKIVMTCLEKVDSWDFDVFAIQDTTGKGSLFYTAYALFLRYDLLRKFNINEKTFLQFITQVEAGYHPNPYHNSMHAADVLHILHYIMSPGKLIETGKLKSEDVFAALFAGMIHDYDHPGINNGFHVKVQSYLATLYNDRSILENHHCAEVFELMKDPNLNIFADLQEEMARNIRETIIEMVLSTDMGLHAKILGLWKRRIGQDYDLHSNKDDQRLALSMAIKMADISNCGRPQQLYLKWANKIAEEFFLQGDRERNLGNPVSPFMDRFNPSMAKGQIAFMNFIVIPLFESISEYLPEMHFSVDHCEQNKNYWATHDDTI